MSATTHSFEHLLSFHSHLKVLYGSEPVLNIVATAIPPGTKSMSDPTTFPFRSIVRILEKSGNTVFQGSGVLVSPDEVLTASHLVWTTGIGVSTSITVAPGYANGIAPFGTITGTVAHYNAINDADGALAAADIANDYALIHLSQPVDTGYMTISSDFAAGTVSVSGYPASAGGALVDLAEPVKLYSDSILTGASIGAGSSGGPLWVTDAAGSPSVVGIVSASDTAGNGYFPRITAAVRAQLLTWIAQDDGVQTVTNYVDNTTGASGTLAMTVATNGPAYLAWSTIWSSPDSVALSTGVPNSFLHGGAGDDALQVTSGRNVLDGGAGSNFLVGGTGTDTFFTDARGSAVVWNTLSNFHAGDTATLWGFSQISSYRWEAEPTGAAGAKGATLRANIIGGAGRTGTGIDASITFAGLTVAQAQGLTISTGVQAAGSYLYLYNPGV